MYPLNRMTGGSHIGLDEVVNKARLENFHLLRYKTVKSVKVNRRFGGTFRPACYLLHADFLFDLFFVPEDGGDIFLQNVGRF
jgi:hypothetical protein